MCGFAFEGLNKNWRMETEITDNELIAKFMGLERKYESTNQVFIDNLKYHTSWDWLMPVVAKIVDLGLAKESSDKVVDRVTTLSGMSIFTPINGVYFVVVEFIKFYNSHKDSNLVKG